MFPWYSKKRKKQSEPDLFSRPKKPAARKPVDLTKKLDKVFCTPHLASGTPEAEINCAVMGARETIDYIENGNIVNSVNLPDVSFGRAEGDRITVIHENKVGMLGLMT